MPVIGNPPEDDDPNNLDENDLTEPVPGEDPVEEIPADDGDTEED